MSRYVQDLTYIELVQWHAECLTYSLPGRPSRVRIAGHFFDEMINLTVAEVRL